MAQRSISLETKGVFRDVVSQIFGAFFPVPSFMAVRSFPAPSEESIRSLNWTSFECVDLGIDVGVSRRIYDVLMKHSVLMSKHGFGMMFSRSSQASLAYLAHDQFVHDTTYHFSDAVLSDFSYLADHVGVSVSVLAVHVLHTLRRFIGIRFVLADLVVNYLKDESVKCMVTSKWQDMTRVHSPQIQVNGRRIGHLRVLAMIKTRLMEDASSVHGGAELKVLLEYYSRPLSTFTSTQLMRVADLIGLPEAPDVSEVYPLMRRTLFRRANFITHKAPLFAMSLKQYVSILTSLRGVGSERI
jgi:hypothetical protein